MTVSNFYPSERLSPFVQAIRIIRSENAVLENRLIPSTSLTIAFRLNGQNAYLGESGREMLPVITVSGLRKSVRIIEYAKQTSTLVVLFREGAAQSFFKPQLHELFEHSQPVDDLIGAKQVRLVEELLGNAATDVERVQIIEQFLLDILVFTEPDQLVLGAVSRIHAAMGIIRIRDLADSLHISSDAFAKRFRKTVGASPKQFASIVRMSCIARSKPQERILDLALSAGYYDQAHFNKDFKLFTGLAPSEFYRSANFW